MKTKEIDGPATLAGLADICRIRQMLLEQIEKGDTVLAKSRLDTLDTVESRFWSELESAIRR